MKLHHRMEKKGWTKKELTHLKGRMKKVHKKRHKGYKLVETVLFWFVLLIAIIISMTLSFVLLLFYVFLEPSFVLFLAGIFGLAFGMLFEVSIRHNDWIEHRHHFVGGVIIFGVVLLNLLMFSDNFIHSVPLFELAIVPVHAVIWLGLVYSLAFFFPFIVHKLTTKRFY